MDPRTAANLQTNYPSREEQAGWRWFLLPSITDWIFILLLIAFSFGGLAPRLLWDADIGWHIRNGEQILSQHAIPHVDSFSESMSGKTWYAWEWLYDVLVGWMHERAGLNGVVLLSALIIAATLALAFRLALRRGGSLVSALVLFVLCALTSSIHFLARPHVAGWLLTIVWYAMLDSHDRGQVQNRRLLWLPLLMVLWANLHGGFVLGLVLTGIFLLANLLKQLKCKIPEQREEARSRVKVLSGILGLCSLASLVNPYGVWLHIHVYQYLTNRFFMQHIEEFRRPDLHRAPAQTFLLMIVLAASGVVAARGKLRWPEWLVLLFAAFSGLYAARNLPVASMLMMIVAAPLLNRRRDDPRRARWGEALGRMRETELRMRGHIWSIAVAVIALIICLHAGTLLGRVLINSHFDPTRMPVEAVDELQQSGAQEPVFSLDTWGGYFIYRLYPQVKVFIDDRHDFYGEDYVREYLKVLHTETGWEDVLDGENVNLIIMPSRSALSSALRSSGKWKVTHEDAVAVTFKRKP